MERAENSAGQAADKDEDEQGQALTDPAGNRFTLGRLSIALSFLALASAGIAIAADLAEASVLTYIFKPVTIKLIIGIAWLSYGMTISSYKMIIIIGLIFSLLGDVLLMAPADLFIFGLAAFLVAQLLYTAAFISVGGFYRSIAAAIPFVLFGLIMGFILALDLDDMLIPTFIYMVVILVMAWQAWGQWQQTKETRARLAFIGAVLFVLSDTALAINRFTTPVVLAPLFVLGTYYPAQYLIALSTGSRYR